MSPLDPRSLAERADTVRGILAELQAGAPAEAGFRRLIALYHHPVYRFFAKRGFPPDDCLDLTQETFLGIYTGISSFRSEASFDTWLFKVAMNVFLKQRRRQGTQKRVGEEVSLDEQAGDAEVPLPAEGPTPGEETLSRERSHLLRKAVETLPPQMRRCLMLRVYQDLKYREIAEVMSLSIDTVKAHLYQARARLQAELGGYFANVFAGERDEA